MKKISVFLVLLASTFALSAQTEAEYEANYAKRIIQEEINGVYIPKDLNDAFNELNSLSDPAGLAKFKKAPEEMIRRKLHFGLGRWIMINWGLEDGSRYSHFLKGKGISLPDDMVRVTIVTWHRYLNEKPQKFEEELAIITKRMEEEKTARDAKSEFIIIEKRPHKE
jgi:hypothetical protein